MKKNKIISFDSKKVWLQKKDGQNTIFKKSSATEVANLTKAKEFLTDKSLSISGVNYSIHVPDVLRWNQDSQTLQMSFCNGMNMELLLRDEKLRKQYIPLFQKMFIFMFKEGFYWEDFAPRNILVDGTNISLVDFEKGLNFYKPNIKNFLRSHVYEEYSSFLLEEERLLDKEVVFSPNSEEKSELIEVSSIPVKRIKATANALGYPPIITKEQYLIIQSMFISAETPRIEQGHIVFPRIYLEEILEDKQTNPRAYIDYASEILKNCKIQNKDNDERTR